MELIILAKCRSSRPEVFCEKALLRPATLLKKEALAKAFSCEFWQISKNTFSYGTPPEAASKNANSQGKCSKTFGSIS